MEAELTYLNTQSQLLFTLKKQIQAMSPLRLSFQNLKNYHQKITADLQTLIDEHDHAILSLSRSNQILCHSAVKIEEQRTAMSNLLRERQNELARLILDNKNACQKHQSLTNKLKLQQNLTQQNKGHQKQLQAIFTNTSSQIQILTKANIYSSDINSQMNKQNNFLGQEIQCQKLRKQNFLQVNDTLKVQISKINQSNQSFSKQNRNLQQHIVLNDKQIQLKVRLNRQLKESEIQLKQSYENIQNQKQYKQSLLKMEEQSMKQLENMLVKMQNFYSRIQREKCQVQAQNQTLRKQIDVQAFKRQESQSFLTSSSTHLNQLKQINQVLLKKMEDYCIQDRQVQNILMKKAQILQNCYRKMNLTGIFNEQSSNIVVSSTLKKQNSYKGSIIDQVSSMSSGKNWNYKQNSSQNKAKKQKMLFA